MKRPKAHFYTTDDPNELLHFSEVTAMCGAILRRPFTKFYLDFDFMPGTALTAALLQEVGSQHKMCLKCAEKPLKNMLYILQPDKQGDVDETLVD